MASNPQDVEADVRALLAELTEAERQVIRQATADSLIRFHHGLGARIRNRMFRHGEPGAWQRWEAFAGRKFQHLDDASSLVIEALWNHLNGRPLRGLSPPG